MLQVWITTPVAQVISNGGTGSVTFNNGRAADLSIIPGNDIVAPRLAALNKLLQDTADTRTPLTSLPGNATERLADPNLPWEYWGDANGDRARDGAQATHLCYRPNYVRLEYIDGELFCISEAHQW